MNLRQQLLALGLILISGSGGFAQDDDLPTDLPADEVAAEEAPAKSGKKKKPVEPPRITDPAVIAILESKPTTPAEEFETAKLLAELLQPELARPRLKKLLDDKLEESTLAGLAEKFGTDAFLRLSKDLNLNPEATELATAVLNAASKIARDPAKLSKLVAQLSDAQEANRQDAIVGLQRGGEASVEPLVRALLDPARKAQHRAVHAMLVRLQGLAIEPLRAMLRDGEFADRVLAADVLSEVPAPAAVPELIAAEYWGYPESAESPAFRNAVLQVRDSFPDGRVAARYFEQEAIRQLELATLIESQDNYGGAAATTQRWKWDGVKKSLSHATISTAAAARTDALHAAQAGARINRDRPAAESAAAKRLRLLAQLENAGTRLSPDAVAEIGKEFDLPDIELLLSQAMRDGYFAAAAGAAELLGQLATPAILIGEGGRPTPLATAARSGDRRLSFAATKAICSLKPEQPFAGASTVSDGLKFFASTAGTKKALVAHPRSGTAQQWAGWLAALGYDVDIATNGREAYAMATGSPDYDFAVVHVALDRAQADDLVRQLRADWRTARLPIALIAMPERTARAERLSDAVPLSTTFAEPQTAADMKFQAERLLSMPGCAPLPIEAKTGQALWAIETLAELNEKKAPWIDARAISKNLERTLYTRGMTKSMIELLAGAGTDGSQRALLNVVARETLPLATRELAALAFARSVAKFGALLSNDEVLLQYDRYNKNAGANADTHKVLLIVLQAIDPELSAEKPKAAK